VRAVRVSEDGLPGEPLFAVALGPVLLRHGLEGAGHDQGDMLRVHVPAPTAAFSRRDTRRTGFPDAVAAAREHGFEPVVRPNGGLLAAYHGGSVVVDHVVRSTELGDVGVRFSHYARRHAEALRGLGIDVRIGMVPDEYCPGEFSLNLGGHTKIAGSAQRVTRDGWLFSTVFQVTGSEPVRGVLERAYRALDYPFDPATVGCLEDSGVSISVNEVAELLARTYDAREVVPVPAGLVAEAAADRGRYVAPGG
jgi:lipoate-protein ligase A